MDEKNSAFIQRYKVCDCLRSQIGINKYSKGFVDVVWFLIEAKVKNIFVPSKESDRIKRRIDGNADDDDTCNLAHRCIDQRSVAFTLNRNSKKWIFFFIDANIGRLNAHW